MDSYRIVDSGIDWITATGDAMGNAGALAAVGYQVLKDKRDAGFEVKLASRFSFRGFASDHFFVGDNDHGACVIVSGSECVPLGAKIIRAADNVSRLDLQVTVSTGIERPYLALDHYRMLRALYVQNSTRRNVSIIQNYPVGETLMLGKRTSDCYGRIYDKGVESKTAAARSLWRYEVELKRKPAAQVALQHVFSDRPLSDVSSFVHQWFTARGCAPRWAPEVDRQAGEPLFHSHTSRYLPWFRDSVRHSVRKAITLHGLVPVVEALGLDELLPEGMHE